MRISQAANMLHHASQFLLFPDRGGQEVGNDQDSVATEDVQKVQPERDFVVQDLVSCIAIGKSFEKPEWLKVEDLDMELVAENPDVCCSGDQVGTTWG
ncbi:hypothetical protein Plec18167_006316 [Paecilomyces lecythidis]|uniref:Uncharacterized protein n=1 Tax=Paecilomyces lecythidis TaxID=3004212 RepID=A0ABR3XC49_9EURO